MLETEKKNNFTEKIAYLYFRIHLLLTRKRLPVHWGNNIWFEYEKFIFYDGRLKKGNKNWIDYSSCPHEITANFLRDDFPHSNFRKRLHLQILDLLQESGASSDKPICIFTCGGTASGKTSAVDELLSGGLSDQFLRIDYDNIKYLLPEYPEMLKMKIKEAATYVQLESVKIGGKAFKKIFGKRINVIYEKTLHEPEKNREHIKDLRKKKYKIIVIAAHLTKENGLIRAEKRFQEKGRYVPEEVISSIYSKVPDALHDLRNKVDEIYLFDNNGDKLQLMFEKTTAGPSVTNQNLYNAYLSYVGSEFDLTK